MKTRSIIIALLVVCLILTASAVLAGSITFSGTLTPGGATEPVVALITTPNCNGSTIVFTMLYSAYNFTVDTSGSYTFTEPGVDSALYVYAGGFDPNNPVANCIAATNSNPLNINVGLSAGVVYTVVVVEDTFAQDGMAFNVGINGPGNITQVGGAAVCPYPLPSDAVQYSLPGGAPAFWAPRMDAQTGFAVSPGVWYMNGFTEEFARVWIACQAQPVYVPVNAISR